jgi:formamidopyrimidine-DNA glycosylase
LNLWEKFVTITFGLKGKLSFKKVKYTKVKFVFENDEGDVKSFYYSDVIKYGNIVLCDSKQDFKKITNQIGIDLLQSDIDDDYIVDSIKKIQKTKYGSKLIIELLMHQKKLGSGIGNYLSAEILYRSKISPHKKIKSLIKKELYALAHSIRKTIKLSYLSNDSDYLQYLTPVLKKVNVDYHSDIDIDPDEDFEFLVYEQAEDSKGNKVKKDKIIPINAKNKRTTYWVPKVQK